MNNKDYEEPLFPIREYSKLELAILYSPRLTTDTAVRKLHRWINLIPALVEELRAVGYRPACRTLTPRQVEIIVRYLGAPG